PEAAAIPAVWASASAIRTPGTRGLSGKCPANTGSLAEKNVEVSAAIPGSHLINSRTKTNGGRWGKPRKGSSSPVDKIDKLPAPLHASDPDPISCIIERGIGKLRRRDPEIVLLHEPLRQDRIQLRPEAVFIPVLENSFA